MKLNWFESDIKQYNISLKSNKLNSGSPGSRDIMWAKQEPTKEGNCFFLAWAKMLLLCSLFLMDIIVVSSRSSVSFEFWGIPLTLYTPGDGTQGIGHAVEVLSWWGQPQPCFKLLSFIVNIIFVFFVMLSLEKKCWQHCLPTSKENYRTPIKGWSGSSIKGIPHLPTPWGITQNFSLMEWPWIDSSSNSMNF